MAAAQVIAQFSQANNYASAAQGRADAFISSLNATVAALQPPDLVLDTEFPQAPELAANVATKIGSVGTSFPADNTGSPPSAVLLGVDTSDVPEALTLPEFTYSPSPDPEKPEMEALDGVTLPAAPGTWTEPTPPALLSINVRAFEGVNSHGDWLARLTTAPDDLVLDAPSPFVSPLPNRYDSALLTDMTSLLRSRLQGGTGLNPAVEQALWDRDRSRIAAAAEASIADAVRDAEARGFTLPTGAMNAKLQEAQKTALAKTAEASHEIAFKQADLEQANVKHAIDQGIALESRLIDYVNAIEQRTFDAAKFAATQALEVYNAVVAKYRVLLEKYKTFADIYRTLIDAEKLKVEVYRADIEAEKIKADINQSLIDQMKIQIDVRNAHIALYRAEVEAAQAVLGADKLKVEAFGERIKAYTAEINSETIKVEAYKAQVQSNDAVAAIHRSRVEAYSARVSAQATASRASADVFDAQSRAYGSRVQAYVARVGAEAEKVRALTSIEGLKIEGQKLEVQQNVSNNQLQIEQYKVLMDQYAAAKQIAMAHTKMLTDNYMAIKAIVADAAKVGAQVNAQMAASAYGTLHAGASISGTGSTNTNYSYSGETSDKQAAPTQVVIG